MGLLCSGGVAIGGTGIVVALLSDQIRPKQITERHLTLDGVHDAFAAALERHRRHHPDPMRARGFGDARDDFDDVAVDHRARYKRDDD